MLDDQVPYRRIAKSALEQWFRQADVADSERVPIRQGRRNELIKKVVAPLRDEMAKKDVDRIVYALGLVVGTDAMIALTDAVGPTWLPPRRRFSTRADGSSQELSAS